MIRQEHRSFTESERSIVIQMVSARCQPEDNQPEEVIATRYKGNIDAYIWDMLAFDETLAGKLHLKL